MGKTQIAVEYAHRHLDEYVYALSANAHSREALVSGYVTIAGLLKLPEADSQDRMLAVEAVKPWPSLLAGPQHSPPLSLTQAPKISVLRGNIMVCPTLLEMLALLSRDAQSRTLCAAAYHLQDSGEAKRRIEAVYRYLSTHFRESCSVPEVAKAVGMNEATFSRFFRRETGRTFIEALIDLRLSYACKNPLQNLMSFCS